MKKYLPFIVPAMLMCILLYIIYPAYQYYIDPDGTAYLTISRRYAEGHLIQAINGYWSPWSCWLTALLIKWAGVMPIPGSVIVNTFGAVGFIYITQSLFLKFNVTKQFQWLLNGALVIFLCYAVFAQSFDDLWECFFLLTSLRIILSDAFMQRSELWAWCGVAGALAYFAKAYAFPFFILNVVCCTYLLAVNKRQWLRVCISTVAMMLIVSFPWIYILHYKYGIWTTSTAGTLNTSWYLVGHPFWRADIGQLLPPAYPDSPYYWEDPFVVNGATPHFWSSAHLFGLQLVRIVLNLFKLTGSMLALSVFFPVIALVVVFSLRRQRKMALPRNIQVLGFSFLLFPLGYMLVNFESRYIWYMLPLSFVLADFIIKRSQAYITRHMPVSVASWLLAISVMLVPLKQLWSMKNEGYDDYQVASQMNLLKINGAFTSNAVNNTDVQSAARIAYFSGNPYYSIPYPETISKGELFNEIKRYRIPYYLFFCRDTGDYKYKLMDASGHQLPELELVKPASVKIFQTDTILTAHAVYRH